jgi:predicted metal-dependent hydrolase
MSTNSYTLQVASIDALVVRKPIKNLHLAVLPPLGKVRVSAPLYMKDDAIRTLLATKLGWINRHKARFQNQARQAPRQYVSGESHYFLGRRYRLEVVYEDNPVDVELHGKNKIILRVRPNTSRAKREEAMMEWYRKELRSIASESLGKWQKAIGVELTAWGIKRMKTRWGTCNERVGRIWLNLELAKKPISCIEYVVVHELLHLIEKKHNERFAALMGQHLPKWRSEKAELNRFILAHEEWRY